jgi:general secretion pathway protein K
MMTGDDNLSYLRKKDGIALIITLMVVALVVAVVVEFNRTAVADLEISGNFSDEIKVTYLAISGVNVIRNLLWLEGLNKREDTLLDEWANGKAYFESANALLDAGKVEGEIIDECGKIAINSLVGEKGQFNETQRQIWERLLKQSRFGLTEEEVQSIIHGVKDWIDEDSEVTGIFGAEDTSYLSRGYHCKNGPLHTLEEMLLINGISKQIFYGNQKREGIRSYFSPYNTRSKINLNTAPLPILMALSDEMTEDIAVEMDKFRRDEANRSSLTSPIWYRRIWPYATPLPESALTASSNVFSTTIKATSGTSVKEIRVVIARAEGAASLLYWQEL